MVRHSQEQRQECDSEAGPVARAAIADDAEPSHRHELKRPRPLMLRNPSSPLVMRTPGGRNSSAKPDVRGNSPARIRCKSANSEGPRRQLSWKRS